MCILKEDGWLVENVTTVSVFSSVKLCGYKMVVQSKTEKRIAAGRGKADQSLVERVWPEPSVSGGAS